MTQTLLISNLSLSNGTRKVLEDVSIEVPAGQIVALLGPNGAGKSELVLGVAGVLSLDSGTVSLGGQFLNGKSVQFIRSAGLAAVPEGHQVLGGLSVQDNLVAAGPMLSRADLAGQVEAVYDIFPELRKLKVQKAGSMSGGQQQMLAIGQALMSKPQFMLIDEMSLGLAPVIIDRLIGVIDRLRESGIGILLIEQFTHLALGVADHCYVLSQGKIRFSGHPAKLKSNPEILETAYLGG